MGVFYKMLKQNFSTTKRIFCMALGVIASTMILSACSEYEQINRKVSKDQGQVDRAFNSIMPKQKVRTPLVVDQRPWFGSSAVPMLNGNPLPAAYQRKNALVLTFTEGVTLQRAVQMIQSVTGIRTQISQSVLGENAAARALADVLFIPVDAEEVTGGRFVWQGRLTDLLDQLSDTFNADWTYDGRIIRFSNEVTRTFMLHALATQLSSDDSLESDDGGDGGTLPTLGLEGTSALDIWGEIQDAIQTIIGRTGEASFSPSTGTITVTGSPEIVRRVEQYLQRQNEMRLRRVAVAIKVLDVTVANNFNFSMDIQGTIAQILRNTPGNLVVNNAGSVLTVARNDPGSQSFNNALENDEIVSTLQLSEEIERISIVHSGAVVTLSDQPAPLQVGRQIAYLERISSTGGDTGGQVSLEPGTVNEGLTMIVLPRIVDRDRIMMRLSVAITDAQEPFATFGQGGENGGGGDDALVIQLPEIATTGFLQNAVIRSGQTMVLAGFERNQNSASDNGTPGGLWTGGSRDTNRSRNLTVLLLTSEILPEDGMAIIGQ